MEQEVTDDAQFSEILSTPLDMPVKSEDDATITGTGASPDGEGLSTKASSELHWRDAYCLLVHVTHNVNSVLALDSKVPDYVWTEVIARDICTYRLWAPAGTFTIELLSDTEFLLFQGPRSGRGMTWENTIEYIWNLHGVTDWGSMEVTVVSGQCTMKQSKIDLANTWEYCQTHTLEQMATAEGRLWALAIEKTKYLVPSPRGRRYTRRADHYFAQKFARTPATEPTLHAMRPTSPEDYHSTHEPSEFEYESEGMEGLDTDSTGYSTMTSYCDTDHSQCSNTKNRDHKCWNQKHHNWQEGHKTNAKKQKDWRSGRVVLPLFWESTKEGALTYTNWWGEVEEYITKGYSSQKIKDAMFTSLEGKAKQNYQACDEKGDLPPKKILERMDMIYSTSMSFWDLNAKLCGLKQGQWEQPKDYYEWMVDISVALKEYHGDWFQLGELTQMKKDCFYAGLRENYKYLVSHLKDREDVNPVFILKEIWESEELQYPVSSSNSPKGSGDGHGKSSSYYDKKNYYKHSHRSYQAQAANIWAEPDEYESDLLSDVETDSEMDDVQQDSSYHVGITNMADEVEDFFGKCCNCGKEGHPWQDCKKPLKPSLKLALKSKNDQKAYWADKKQLNQTGGAGAKGDRVPKAGMGKALLALAKNWEPPVTLPVPTGMKMCETGGWDLKMLDRS